MNKIMHDLSNRTVDMRMKLRTMLTAYDELYREANRSFVHERNASGSTEGLEDFYILVQTVRRNRDVMAAVLRGFSNLRPLDQFKIVEEDTTKPRRATKKRLLQSEPQEEVVTNG